MVFSGVDGFRRGNVTPFAVLPTQASISELKPDAEDRVAPDLKVTLPSLNP